jgi:hypothetical protein
MALSRTLANLGDSLGGATSNVNVVNSTLYVDAVGNNVGIGTSSLTYKLEVNQPTASLGGMRITQPTGTVASSAAVRAIGYSPSYELMDKDQLQNWYFGINNNDSRKLYVGRGYGPNQGVSPAIMVDTSDNVGFNSGYGSAATVYGCRAWINYNGTSATIRASGNITSVTKNATGDYTLNFTTAMPDVNYSAFTFGGSQVGSSSRIYMENHDNVLRSTTQIRIYSLNGSFTPTDSIIFSAAIIR